MYRSCVQDDEHHLVTRQPGQHVEPRAARPHGGTERRRAGLRKVPPQHEPLQRERRQPGHAARAAGRALPHPPHGDESAAVDGGGVRVHSAAAWPPAHPSAASPGAASGASRSSVRLGLGASAGHGRAEGSGATGATCFPPGDLRHKGVRRAVGLGHRITLDNPPK
jgi:hypothetical protein